MMGILTRTIAGAMSTPDKPIFSPAHCLNRRQHKKPCTLCQDLCPGHVFSPDPREPLHWDQCTNCGLCVAACPSRCFAPGQKLQKDYTEGLNLSAPVSFACFSEGSSCTRRVECLAGIPWELAATLALYTHVVFYVGACSRCEHAGRVDCLRNNLILLRDFLGEKHFSARIHILSQGKFELPGTDAALSRRALFTGLGQNIGKNVARTALNLLPFSDDDSSSDGFAYRRLLADTVMRTRENAKKAQEEYRAAAAATPHDAAQATAAQASSDAAQATAAPTPSDAARAAGSAPPPLPSFGVRLPRYTKACFACSICERICPHGALEVSPEKDGKRTIYVTPWKCTGCGMCSHICPHGGSAGIHLVSVPHMNRLPLVRVDSASCERCGVAIRPGTASNLCAVCARKAKKKVR